MRKGLILAITLSISLTSVNIFEDVEAIENPVNFNNYGFSIDYSKDWKLEDSFESNRSNFLIKPDNQGSQISIKLLKQYSIADNYNPTFITINNVEQIGFLEEDFQNACKINKNGPCWNFKLIDSKIMYLNDNQVISIEHEAVVNNKKTFFRTIIIPQENNFWWIEGRAVNDITYSKISEVIQTFRLGSTSAKEVQRDIDSQTVSKSNYLITNDDEIILERKLDINLILIGEEWTTGLKNEIKSELPVSREPHYVFQNEPIGIRHSYNYNFISVEEEKVNKVSSFMNENFQPTLIPGYGIFDDFRFWQAEWIEALHPEWVAYDNQGNFQGYLVDYGLIDAEAMEKFLFNEFVSIDKNRTSQDSINLIFLAMDLNEAPFLRNYYLNNRDDSTNENFSYFGLMGYGGNHNMMYFDLYSAPWIDYDYNFDLVFPEWLSNAHDCSSNQCMADMIGYHTENALMFIVTPDLIYPVKSSDKFTIDLVVYTKPGGSNTVTPATLKKFVNEDKVLKEFQFLYPQSEWSLNINLERRDTRGLSYDFKKSLESTKSFTFSDSLFGVEKTIQILDSDKITPYLLENSLNNINTSDEVYKIPTIIEIDSSENIDLYVDGYGTLGIATSFPESGEACCVFGVTSQKKMWNDKIGFTYVLVHEVGHHMGLMHSFMTTDEFGDIAQNNYFNWYSSPMTYSSPSNTACGFIYSLLYTEPCGNSSLSFTDFERNIISEARLVKLWSETEENILITKNDLAKELLTKSKNSYQQKDVFSDNGALALANQAFKESKNTFNQSKLPEIQNSPLLTVKQSKVPEWVKNNAKWWSDGQVDDSTFSQGIGFLIKEKVISVSSLPPPASAVAEEKIPGWIKNNAKWWADGMISEDDFLKGITYMVEKGIVKVQ